MSSSGWDVSRARMPGTPVGVFLRVGCLGQGAVHTMPIGISGRSVGGRADEWVHELDASPDGEQPGIHCGGGRGHTDPEDLDRALQQDRIAQGLRGGGQNQQLRLGGEQQETLGDSSVRSCWRRDDGRGARIRRRDRRCATRVATREGQAGFRGSRGRSGRRPRRRTDPEDSPVGASARRCRPDHSAAAPVVRRGPRCRPRCAPRRRGRSALPRGGVRRRGRSAPTRHQATARRRSHRGAVVAQRPQTTRSGQRGRPETDPGPGPIADRTQSPAHRAAGSATGPGDPASAQGVDAARCRRAPSRLRPRPKSRRANRGSARPDTPAERSCPHPPRRGGRGPGSDHRARRPSPRQATHTRPVVQAAS